MGMYTEIFVNADLKEDTPKEVINVLIAMCGKNHTSKHLSEKPKRWACLFNNGSCYVPSTQVAKLTYNRFCQNYSLIAKGDIKNYKNEIEQFFEYIKPWCEGEFIGYYRYEENREPVLVYADL
jgi:hypothetical protein